MGETRYALDAVPDGAWCRSVTAEPTVRDGRGCLRVALTQEVRRGVRGVDYVDQPTFVVLPVELETGRIEVDLVGDVLPDAPDDARGFAGLAFAITPPTAGRGAGSAGEGDVSAFECVYVRPYNGLTVAPDEVRRGRAIQYFAYPDWPFSRLREERPGEGFEGALDIRPGAWMHLVVEVGSDRVRAEVDQVTVVDRARVGVPRPGQLGLYVDIGTEAWFRNLVVTV